MSTTLVASKGHDIYTKTKYIWWKVTAPDIVYNTKLVLSSWNLAIKSRDIPILTAQFW